MDGPTASTETVIIIIFNFAQTLGLIQLAEDALRAASNTRSTVALLPELVLFSFSVCYVFFFGTELHFLQCDVGFVKNL